MLSSAVGIVNGVPIMLVSRSFPSATAVLASPPGRFMNLFPNLTMGLLAIITATMRCCNENHPRHERLRFEEHRASGQVARLGIQFRTVKRDRRDIVPEAIAAIDDHHLRQETSLAMADQYHLIERSVPSLGIDVLAHSLERFPQTHRRQRDRIAAVINEEPELITRGDRRIAEQFIRHLGPACGA